MIEIWPWLNFTLFLNKMIGYTLMDPLEFALLLLFLFTKQLDFLKVMIFKDLNSLLEICTKWIFMTKVVAKDLLNVKLLILIYLTVKLWVIILLILPMMDGALLNLMIRCLKDALPNPPYSKELPLDPTLVDWNQFLFLIKFEFITLIYLLLLDSYNKYLDIYII